MTLPNAIIIGPMKAGTTWIHDYLAARGDVRLPNEVKETFFFDRHFDRGVDWYRKRFDCSSESELQQCTIEVAPSLFHNPQAPCRVRSTLGNITIVVTTRDPIARSWSHFLHLRRKGYTKSSLQEAVVEFPQVINASRYEERLGEWHEHFSEDQIHVLPLDLLIADRDLYLRKLCGILNIPFVPAPEGQKGKANATGLAPSFYFARIGRKLATRLRSAGYYRTVNFAKSLGLKRLFFGRPSTNSHRPQATEEETVFLRHVLGITDK